LIESVKSARRADRETMAMANQIAPLDGVEKTLTELINEFPDEKRLKSSHFPTLLTVKTKWRKENLLLCWVILAKNIQYLRKRT
jgi:hypothetical protein